MMKRSPKKHNRQAQGDENQNQTYDDSEDESERKGLREADISKLPPHLFQNLKKIACTVGDGEGLTAEDLEAAANGDAEVWIIQCPKHVDPTAVFSGKKISLGEDDISVLNTLSDNEDFIEFDRLVNNRNPKEKTKSTYEALSLPSKGDGDSLITLVPDSEGNRRIIATSVSGSIIVRQSIEDVPLTELVPRPSGKKQLPPGLKCHHPIYGVDFSHAKDIDNKPDSDDERYAKKSRKKKKSKSYDDSYSSPTPTKPKYDGCDQKTVENYFDNLYNLRIPGVPNSLSNGYPSSETWMESPKKKKKKRKNHDTESTEYETQEETFVMPIVEEIQEEEVVAKKKKSKKRKREEEEHNFNGDEYNLDVSEDVSAPKAKKHKKNKSKHKDSEEVY